MSPMTLSWRCKGGIKLILRFMTVAFFATVVFALCLASLGMYDRKGLLVILHDSSD